MIPTLIEVAERSAPEQREPAPTLMLRAVVQHVAALAEGLQVRGSVVGWVVIEMRAGQDHARRPDSPLPQPQRGEPREWSAVSITPPLLVAIPPAPIAQVADHASVRAAAPFAFALRSSEADHGRKLGPVDGVEPAIAGMDRHQRAARCLALLCQNQLGQLVLLINATLFDQIVPRVLRTERASLTLDGRARKSRYPTSPATTRALGSRQSPRRSLGASNASRPTGAPTETRVTASRWTGRPDHARFCRAPWLGFARNKAISTGPSENCPALARSVRLRRYPPGLLTPSPF